LKVKEENSKGKEGVRQRSAIYFFHYSLFLKVAHSNLFDKQDLDSKQHHLHHKLSPFICQFISKDIASQINQKITTFGLFNDHQPFNYFIYLRHYLISFLISIQFGQIYIRAFKFHFEGIK
jgi:hypothetical protein